MTSPVPAFAPSRDRFAKDVAISRASLAEGTPEKYPGAKAVVLILDAEAVLDENERLREALRQYDTALAVLDASAKRITDDSPDEWIIEYRWSCGPFHKLLGLRSHIPALAAEYERAMRAVEAETAEIDALTAREGGNG